MNLNAPFVITLSREIGSGGHTVGQILADKLKTFYFDKYVIEELTKKFGLTTSAIEKLKGEKKNWLVEMLHSLAPMPSARALMKSIDEARENYIKRHTGTSRYDARNYDLVLKADAHSEEELANLILSYIG